MSTRDMIADYLEAARALMSGDDVRVYLRVISSRPTFAGKMVVHVTSRSLDEK